MLFRSIPKQPSVAFSRPADPNGEGYSERRQQNERSIARTVQVHQCGLACMKVSKGRLSCKRRAPYALSDTDWVDETGLWSPKRTYAYFNNWCPTVLECLRANNDIKLITNGAQTKAIAWYITNYVAKKQKQSFNTSALLAKTLAYHREEEKQTHDLAKLNKKLIQRCANTLSRRQELSAPEVISYLMGWGDRYISHRFETIHWHSVVNLLKKAYPELNTVR